MPPPKWAQTDEIVRRPIPTREKSAPFTRQAPTHVRNNGSKGIDHYKYVTIPYLRSQIRGLRLQVKKLQKQKKEIRTTRTQNNKKYRDRVHWRNFYKKRALVKKGARDAYVKMHRILFEKHSKIILGNSHYIDGITAMPFMVQWCNLNGFDLLQFNIFVLIHHHKWFTLKDALFYGYKYDSTRKTALQLTRLGLVEKSTTNRKSVYYVNEIGKKKFQEFHRFFMKKIKELYKHLDRQNLDGELWVDIEKPRKFRNFKQMRENGKDPYNEHLEVD